MITAENLNKYYHNGNIETHVLKDVNVNLNKGEFVAILGKSGSGKSTLLNILSTLMKADSGKICYNSLDYFKMKEADLNKIRNEKFSVIFQFHYLIPYLTALENVLLPFSKSLIPVSKDDIEYAKECLDKVGLEGKYDRLPNQLSGGEQQRVAIARALVKKPEVIFADEPTGNLDGENSMIVANIFKQLNNEGYAILMVTHDKSVADFAGRIITMRDGQIVN
ncbi:ABC transporter ATP-binding protein [Deferribacteraceae bacterium V6Fe1]|nr:ABC transporter ATP-binding protein [Deferribacteraceae bacterium V6Fe1]